MSSAEGVVLSLIGELRSHMPNGMIKKKGGQLLERCLCTGKREGVESESFILNPGVPLTGYAWARRLLFFFFLKDLIF